MASVKAILRINHTNKNGEAPLRVRLLHQKQIKEITIPGVRIKPHLWDPVKQAVKGDKMLTARISNKIAEYKTAINKAIVLEESIDLSNIHNIVTGEVDSSHNILVHKYMERKIIEDMSLSYGTRQYYKTLFNIIKSEYPKLKLKDVNGEFMTQFDEKLRKQGLSQWTRHNRLKCLKRTINRAYEERLINSTDWRGFVNKKGTSLRVCLTKSELSILRDALESIPVDSTDHYILKAFLFSCLCSGMRFGDLMMLSYKDISIRNDGNLQLSYTMRKTKKHVQIPLNKIAYELIDMNLIGSSEMVFKLAPNRIKYMSDDEISKRISSRNAYCNQRLKRIVKQTEINKHLSFHCSRITFCSIAISLGMSRFMITEIAGLSMKVLEKHYAKYFDDEKLNAVALFDSI